MRLIVRSEIPHVGDDGTLGADRGARSGVVEVAKRPELPACPRLAARQIVRIVFPVLDLSVLVEADLQYHGCVASPRDKQWYPGSPSFQLHRQQTCSRSKSQSRDYYNLCWSSAARQ